MRTEPVDGVLSIVLMLEIHERGQWCVVAEWSASAADGRWLAHHLLDAARRLDGKP